MRILTIKNAKLSEYYFYMNLNVWGDFEIFISVPLIVASSFMNRDVSSSMNLSQNILMTFKFS